jgi:hypothetical protein
VAAFGAEPLSDPLGTAGSPTLTHDRAAPGPSSARAPEPPALCSLAISGRLELAIALQRPVSNQFDVLLARDAPDSPASARTGVDARAFLSVSVVPRRSARSARNASAGVRRQAASRGWAGSLPDRLPDRCLLPGQMQRLFARTEDALSSCRRRFRARTPCTQEDVTDRRDRSSNPASSACGRSTNASATARLRVALVAACGNRLPSGTLEIPRALTTARAFRGADQYCSDRCKKTRVPRSPHWGRLVGQSSSPELIPVGSVHAATDQRT